MFFIPITTHVLQRNSDITEGLKVMDKVEVIKEYKRNWRNYLRRMERD